MPDQDARRVVIPPPDGTQLLRLDPGMHCDGARLIVANVGAGPNVPLWLTDLRAVGDPRTDEHGVTWQSYASEADWYRARDLGGYQDGAVKEIAADRVWVEYWRPTTTYADLLGR